MPMGGRDGYISFTKDRTRPRSIGSSEAAMLLLFFTLACHPNGADSSVRY